VPSGICQQIKGYLVNESIDQDNCENGFASGSALGNFITGYRTFYSLSETDLAKALHVRLHEVADLEYHGHRLFLQPQAELIRDLARAFDVSPTEVMAAAFEDGAKDVANATVQESGERRAAIELTSPTLEGLLRLGIIETTTNGMRVIPSVIDDADLEDVLVRYVVASEERSHA
jgi:transcriptional regulator with XRE-family HTH domain